jgi:cytoskeletal protein RodZ
MKSIGHILLQQRESKRLTLEDVYKFIKIHPRYLNALETDDYSVFEGKVHAKGFLKVYTEFLGLNLSEILALWRREYEGDLEKRKEEHFHQLKSLDSEKFVLTSSTIIGGIAMLLIVLFFGYLFYQYKNYTGAPRLEINYPQNNMVTNTDILDVTGKTELDTDVFINNQKLVLNTDGTFVTSIKLKEGINNISINAVNKLNKKTELIRTIIYRPQNGQNSPMPIPQTSESTESTDSTKPPSL